MRAGDPPPDVPETARRGGPRTARPVRAWRSYARSQLQTYMESCYDITIYESHRSPQPQLIAIGKLETSALNVRKTQTQDGIDEMKASILSHGLIQNLTVVEPDAGDGKFHVVAGEGRRLEAIRSNCRPRASCPSDFHAVPCQARERLNRRRWK